jgi:hypothetical protein
MKAGTNGVNIQEWQDASGVRLSRVGAHGEVEVNVTDPATSPLLLKMAASQTADGLQLRKSDNSIPFKVDKDGDLTAASLTTGGPVAAASAAITGDVATATVHATGAVSAGSAAVTGAVTAGSVAATGAVTGNNLPQVRTADAGKRIMSGTLTDTISGGVASGTLTFPTAFSSATGVVVTATVHVGSNLDMAINWQSPPTASGVGYRVFQKDAVSVSGSCTIHWIAMGPN